MGNLCSSGADIADKKEENKVPDVKDGENEALLLKYVPHYDGVPVSADCGGDGGGGNDGVLDGVMKSGDAASGDLVRSGNGEGCCVAIQNQPVFVEAGNSGHDVLASGDMALLDNATVSATEAAASVRSTVEDAVSEGVNLIQTKADEVSQIVTTAQEDIFQQDVNKINETVWNDHSDVVGTGGGIETGVSTVPGQDLTNTNDISDVSSWPAAENDPAADMHLETGQSKPELGLEETRGLEGSNSNIELEIEETGLSSLSASQDGVLADVTQWIEEKFSEAKATNFRVEENSEESVRFGLNQTAESSGVADSASMYNDIMVENCNYLSETHLASSTVQTCQSVEGDSEGIDHVQESVDNAQSAAYLENSDSGDVQNVPENIYHGDIIQAACAEVRQSTSTQELDSEQSGQVLKGNDLQSLVASQGVGRIEGQEMVVDFENFTNQVAGKDTLNDILSPQEAPQQQSQEISEIRAKELAPADTEFLSDEGNEKCGTEETLEQSPLEQAQSGEVVEKSLDTAVSLFQSEGQNPPPVDDVAGGDITEVGDPHEQISNVENNSHGTTKNLVESITENATALVSAGQNATTNENSSISDTYVERGEETLAPNKRGVIFVSSHAPESSISLPAPPELSLPPPTDQDLSARSDSSNSSISQADLIERDELLMPPPSPAELYSHTDNDESIQRAAVDLTTKAVQDAIRIVADSGSGDHDRGDEEVNNDLRDNLTSVSEFDDSTYTELVSPLQEFDGTCADENVSQSVPNVCPETTNDERSSLESTSPSVPESNGREDNALDLINFEEYATVSTPDSALPVTSDTCLALDTRDDEQINTNGNCPPFASDILSFFPDNNELPSSKPVIVINSPDSAHHTNGSSDDVSSPHSEALI